MKSTDRPGRPTDRLGPARYGMGAHFPPSGDQSSRPDKVAAGYCWPDGLGTGPGAGGNGDEFDRLQLRQPVQSIFAPLHTPRCHSR